MLLKKSCEQMSHAEITPIITLAQFIDPRRHCFLGSKREREKSDFVLSSSYYSYLAHRALLSQRVLVTTSNRFFLSYFFFFILRVHRAARVALSLKHVVMESRLVDRNFRSGRILRFTAN